MIHALFTGSDQTVFKYLMGVFKDHEIHITWSESGTTAFEMISANDYQIVVTDENLSDMTGFQLIRKLIEINPMINCAVISTLSEANYHEQSEGLGLLMQLPAHPSSEDGKKLLKQLDSILSLTKGIK